ncbi:MAG: exo-alpha-sialidase [Acidimicrobiia bacterium]|nr:exo-alpha-sialidase [Acidimicrobiia bacterium]
MFPSIYKLRNGRLMTRVCVGGDAYPRNYLYYVSEDGGANWQHFASYDQNNQRAVEKPGSEIALRLPDGEELQVLEPWMPSEIRVAGLNVKSYPGGYHRLGDLPRDMQGVRLFTRKPGQEQWTEERAYLDPDILVKEKDPFFGSTSLAPLTMHWLSENHILKDGSLMTTFLRGVPMLSELRPDGTLDQVSHPIMRSYDRGRTWKFQGAIPPCTFLPFWLPGKATLRAHVLEFPNGNWVAAFRHGGMYSSGGGPLVIRKSSDQGKSWSEPKAIRVPGVNPLGLMLGNGIAVFSYNRPGVFLTFCADGKGDLWGNDMTLVKGWRHQRNENSCGNGCFLATGPDRFIYVYTQWDVPDPWGQPRQAVIAQEFVVSKKDGRR